MSNVTVVNKKKDKIRVALIGHGHLGQFHAQKVNQIENTQLTVVVDSNAKALESASNLYPDITTSKNLSNVLDLFDAALIVVPTQFHAPFISQLMKANKHIFCEKPICATLEELDTLIELKGHTDPSLVFMAGHSERIHQGPHTNKKAQPLLETTQVIQIQRLAPFKARATDVEVVSDLMIHDLDLLYYIFNELPQKVFAFGNKWPTDKWDYVNCTLFFPSGRIAHIVTHRGHTLEKRSWEFFSPMGMIQWDLKNRVYQIYEDPKKLSLVDQVNYATQDHLRVEQNYFIQSIREKKPSFVTFEEGATIVKIIHKIIESINTQQICEI